MEAETQSHKSLDNWTPEIAVDFDGTLARYDGFKGHHLTDLGEPIEAMTTLVKYWEFQGKKVVIFTARATDDEEGEYAKSQIRLWLDKYGFNPELEITNIKKRSFQEIYDDRAYQVIKNQGLIIGVKNA